MSYSRHMKKASIRERVLISWVIVAVIFFIIGFGIGWGCRVLHKGLAQKPEAEKALVYGRYDGIIFEGEIMEVKDDDEFVLLDVPISEDLQKFIFYLSKGYEIDFTFVMALIQQESIFELM